VTGGADAAITAYGRDTKSCWQKTRLPAVRTIADTSRTVLTRLSSDWAWLTQLTIAVGASTWLEARRDPSTR